MANEALMQEAMDSILNYDAAAATDVATRALAAGMTPGDVMAEGFIKGSRSSVSFSRAARSFFPS
jgi:methanogenic corrinoid protein MtbC1